MAVTPAIVLAKLQGLDISTEVLDHPAVLTVEVRSAHQTTSRVMCMTNTFAKNIPLVYLYLF